MSNEDCTVEIPSIVVSLANSDEETCTNIDSIDNVLAHDINPVPDERFNEINSSVDVDLLAKVDTEHKETEVKEHPPCNNHLDVQTCAAIINENSTIENDQPFDNIGKLMADEDVGRKEDGYYKDFDIGSTESGLWFKGHTPLPSESEDEGDVVKDQCEKILSFEHQYALPVVSTQPLHGPKLVRNDFSFDEQDFRRHRNSSKALHGLAPHMINKHSWQRQKSRHSKSKEKSLERLAAEETDSIPLVNLQGLDQADSVETPRKSRAATVGALHPISELKESDMVESRSRSSSLNETMKETTTPKISDDAMDKRKKHRRHKHHHHARHKRHQGINAQDNLEMRIKSGMLKLEEERKAYQGALAEIEEDIAQKDIEDITSHRLGEFQSIRRYTQRRRHARSGMTTHMSSDVESIHSFKPHMHIEMDENPMSLLPKESRVNSEQLEKKGFVELEELIKNENNELQWKERARWIKFEEDVEKNERWGKPHVASLSFQSLLELRRGIETGSVLLNLDKHDLPSIFESVVDNMVITDQLSDVLKEQVIAILLSKHCHHHQNHHNRSFRSRSFSLSSQNSFRNVDSKTTQDSIPMETIEQINGSIEFPESESLTKHEERTVSFLDLERQATLEAMKKAEDKNNGYVRQKSNSVRFAKEEPNIAQLKGESDVKEKIPIGAEATSVLVGTLAELERPAMAFVRLSQGRYLGNLTEVDIPIRFMFVILGPPSTHDYYEIGRSIATLMSDKIFHDLAYTAKSRDDLLAAINSFLDDSIVLAPGDWDRHLLLPLLQAEISEKRRQRIKLLKEKAHLDGDQSDQPFIRTGKCFGGLKRDIRRKSKFYISDFKDGINWRCFVTIIFAFFATLAPTIAFGALLSKKTSNKLGVRETIMATSLCGVVFSLTAGQPLIIVGITGPILVFEQATYALCEFFDVNFLVWRCWIGLFVMLILFLIVAFELCYLVEYFSRFTEEVFSVLISLLFMYECGSFIYNTFKKNPLKKYKSPPLGYSDTLNFTQVLNNDASSVEKVQYRATLSEAYSCYDHANVALITLLIVIGTFFIAYWLRKLRCSNFFTSKARRVLSDFGVPIAMSLMVIVNLFGHDIENIPKIKFPKGFSPTNPVRDNFFVNPLENMELMYVLVALPIAACVSILLFMETELTGVLLNKRKNKLKKGGGYNLDLCVMGLLTGVCSVLGLPWMCAGTVRSVQHQNALAIMSRSHAPGERPYLLHIKEQRLTNLCIHILMGCCLFAAPVLELIPLAVCFGVLMYLGVSSLSGIQFIEQLKLILTPMKYHPNKKYVRCVKFRSLVSYTLIQLFCLLILIGLKLSPAAPTFPFVLICMVFLRRFIERYFSEEELEDLDNEDDEDEFEDDEYCIGLPM